MTLNIESRCKQLISELGLGSAKDVQAVEPLTGGVASDIARLRVADRDICVKFALPKLKVAEDWHAPVHRNAAEYAWLSVAAKTAPENAVQLLGRSEVAHGFAMEFVSGKNVFLWKEKLLRGDVPIGAAFAVGEFLGRIHAASAQPGFDASAFQNRDDFKALRIEPYLTFTAGRHPDLAVALHQLAHELYEANRVLVHGDVSPKNILLRGPHPVLLDAECATMGSACFDVAFCLNHLVLKAIHLPAARTALLIEAQDFWRAYATRASFQSIPELEAQVCRLLAALMLARIDGKSPVEYLSDTERADVRGISTNLIQSPSGTLAETLDRISDHLKEPAE